MVAYIAAAILAAGLIAALLPWRLSIALSARGTPDGAWALAGGAQFAGVAATYTRARGVPASVGVRFLGVRVLPQRRAPRAPRRAPWRRLAGWIDPLDVALFLVDEARHVTIRDLDATVRLGLSDVALAGEISGVLSVLSGLAAPFGRLRHEIDWSGREALEASVSASVCFAPALLLWDTGRFAARSLARRRRRAGRGGAALPPPAGA
jgi:hypothetical protein